MMPNAVGLVLVEGHEGEGDIMAQAAFDVPTRRGATAISTSEYVAGAMSRTRAMADDHRPHAIGVTWSDDSELEASLLLKSLTEDGFDNIVAIRSPEAGEALARGIGRAVGYQQTAVCLLEPESVVVSLIDTYDGAVQTVSRQGRDAETGLIDWLSDVFDVNDWHPECLIVVGPDAGQTALMKHLEQAVHVPVFAPPEAELALARGAALASALGPEEKRRRAQPLPYSAALTMLVVGVLAFVVSVSLAAGLELTSNSRAVTAEQPAAIPLAPPPAIQVEPAPAAPPPAEAAPPPEPAPVPSEEPSAEPPVEQAEQASANEPEQAPAPDQAPAPEPAPPVYIPPPTAAEPAAPPQKPPLMTRILGRIPGLHSKPQPTVDTSPPAAVVITPEGPPPP